MKNEFLAKSEDKKTIEEHTKDLLFQYDILKKLYPRILSEEGWDILRYAIIYHDLGKINTKFQNKLYEILGIDKLEDIFDFKEIPHNYLSPCFIDYKKIKEKYGDKYLKILYNAIYFHHNRDDEYIGHNVRKVVDEDISKDIDEINPFLGENISVTSKYLNQYGFCNNCEDNTIMNSREYILIKGLLNKLDYIASLDIDEVNVEEDVHGLHEQVKKYIENLGEIREVQKYMYDNSDNDSIVVAPTGIGKTEAALLWIGDNKGIYTLPLKVTINAIYKRVKNEINYNKALLLHSDSYSYYLNEDEETLLQKHNKARRLSAPLLITTVDQVFKVSLKYKGYEEIASTFAYSKIVIDEIQMYSPIILAHILLCLKMIKDMGGKFAIITATFPPVLYDLLEEVGISEKPKIKAFPALIQNRHKIKVYENEDFDLNMIEKLAREKRVLIVVNTVKKAQEIYKNLNIENKFLLHSRFTKKHRKMLEDKIMNHGKVEYKEPCVWVSTQIVEASLDIDFDVLFTSMCGIDSLFQRMGRVYRKREYNDEEPNVHIYDNHNGTESKNRPVVDPEIYEYSLKEILKHDGEMLLEDTKQEVIQDIFDLDKNKELKKSKYYTQILTNIRNNKDRLPNTIEKVETNELFRDICNIDVIPDELYDKLYVTIDLNIIKENSITVPFNKDVADLRTEVVKKSGIYRTSLKYEFNEDSLKGLGLINEKQSNFDE